MSPERNLPAWPLGCGLAFFNLLLLINTFAMVGALSASSRLAATPAVLLPYLAIIPLPLAEVAAAIGLRRRNPYAARTLWWALGFTLVLSMGLLAITSWLDAVNGL